MCHVTIADYSLRVGRHRVSSKQAKNSTSEEDENDEELLENMTSAASLVDNDLEGSVHSAPTPPDSPTGGGHQQQTTTSGSRRKSSVRQLASNQQTTASRALDMRRHFFAVGQYSTLLHHSLVALRTRI